MITTRKYEYFFYSGSWQLEKEIERLKGAYRLKKTYYDNDVMSQVAVFKRLRKEIIK